MGDDQKYSVLLKEIGKLLADKNDRIMFQEFELTTLRKELEKAEATIEELKKDNEK